MKGFHDKVLHINLSQRSFEEGNIDGEVYRELLGGKGLGTYFLLNNTRAGLDPLSEGNVIIFATGPVTDTKVFGSSRYGAFTKSPLTGIYCECYAGGSVAEPLSRTGYDAIIIKGASEKPVYLEISNGNMEFHGASHLWGKDTYETEDAITLLSQVINVHNVTFTHNVTRHSRCSYRLIHSSVSPIGCLLDGENYYFGVSCEGIVIVPESKSGLFS